MLLAQLAEFSFVQREHVLPGLLQQAADHGDPLERRAEVDVVALEGAGGRAVGGGGHVAEQPLDEVHHPVVVLVRHVKLHDRELRVVGAVHALVPEVPAELVHPVEAADDQALQVELVGDTQVVGHVQRVVVRDEGLGRGTAGNGLQHRGVHLHVTGVVQVAAHGAHRAGALHEGLLHPGVHHQVHVAHAVPQFGVGEGIVHVALLVGLHHGQRPQGLGQHGELLHVERQFPGAGAEREAPQSDEVAQVQQLLEDLVVERLVLAGADLVAGDVDLLIPGVVAQHGEAGLAHDAHAHQAAGHHHVGGGLFTFRRACSGKVLLEGGRGMRDRESGGRKGLDAQFAELVQGLAAGDLLVGQGVGHGVPDEGPQRYPATGRAGSA